MKRSFEMVFSVMCMLLLASCSFSFQTNEVNSTDDSLPETTAAEIETTKTVMPTETTVPEETVLQTAPPEPASDDVFVKVVDYIPGIVVEIRYSTENNFTGQIIYPFSDAYLRYGTVKKLMFVQKELEAEGMSLKLWDGFRPPAAQFKLWEICPDPTYVSNPNNGFSSHSRGNTVDITIVYQEGPELVMPTGFDDFSTLADRDYSDCTPEAASNARYLENLMTKYGFKGYFGEWWHYTDTDSYDVEHEFLSQ